MSACPKCQSPTVDDFGLVTCSSCGTSLMIGMDGNVSLASDGAKSDANFDVSEQLSNALSKEALGESLVGEVEESGTENKDMFSEDNEPEEFFGDENIEVEDALMPPGDEAAEDSLENTSFSYPVMENSGQGAVLDVADATPAKSADLSGESFEDVVEFGNSDDSTWGEGNLRYKVLISGLDSNDIRRSVREIISEPQFKWDAQTMFAQIDKGELVIQGINPVKASELIKKLRVLSIDVSWEQYVLQQTN